MASPPPPNDDRLDSWKEIAAYLDRGVRTVQRWERTEKLPVHRIGNSPVHAYKSELDQWWKEHSRLAAETTDAEPGPGASRKAAWWIAGALATAALVLIVLSRREMTVETTLIRPVPLTHEVGVEVQPAWSPDGRTIAYACAEVKQQPDICVKPLDGTPARKMMQTPEAAEFLPAWSPDGRSLAFVRATREKTALVVIPKGGGLESTVLEGKERLGLTGWTADGRSLLIAMEGRVALAAVSTGTLTTLVESANLRRPVWLSPNQDRLIYAEIGAVGQAYLMEQRLKAGKAEGKPRQVTRADWAQEGLIMPDGKEVLYTQGLGEERLSIFRMKIAMDAKAELVYEGHAYVGEMAVSADGRQLAFTALPWQHIETWALDVKTGETRSFLTSSHSDMNPDWSPDGKWVTFHSTRSERSEIWVASANGEQARELTRMEKRTTATPRWSPDGAHIAFESGSSGQWQVYVVRAAGGPPEAITTDKSMNAFPSWSRDGKHLYFMSDRSGTREIWRSPFPAKGAGPEQITHGGGAVGVESSDGRYLYYTQRRDSAKLLRMDLHERASAPVEIAPHVRGLFFAVGREGIYFMSAGRVLSFWDAATRTIREVLRTPKSLYIGLALSPDERTLLYTQADAATSDLYLTQLPAR